LERSNVGPKATKWQLVEEVLTDFPAAREDNRVLVLKAWEREGLLLTEEQWAMVGKLTQPETLRRHGCKLRNEKRRFEGKR
jgi:hypothetical protein